MPGAQVTSGAAPAYREVADFEAPIKLLQARGTVLHRDPSRRPGHKADMLLDPSGYTVGLYESATPQALTVLNT
jgi:hypothetical protein